MTAAGEEGEYSSLEHESVSGVVESLKIITRTNSLRIADYAFKLAREKGRKKITAVHKANIMKLGDGLFLQCCKEVASSYPDITFESMIVDNTTMQLVSNPQQFNVMSVSGVVESLKIITRTNSLRIADYAFKLAREKGRKKITAVHKANIMKLGDGLFLQCCKEVASSYPDITFESMIVDNTTMQLVSNPQQFNVMVMPNLYGNIVNNVCPGLLGVPGLVSGANYGSVYAVFETATRNTGKSIANKNIANPTAMLLASCMMLDHLKLYSYAASIRKAILGSINEHRMHTPDIGGQGTTSEVVQSICRQIIVKNGRAVTV
ncbi:unnamed protein product [Ranitomeya imitator]|uniref:Isopropylmalate dehydrogenase-like domain-containing protein n=1 Tax=Ranitomeya imitator TaxID=111125 RepID=A0ABN9MB63_9NEOB|nr:unnamed protein product [Ranitomeya imitator]